MLAAVGFFLERRIRNPVYSKLFQDLLKREDTVDMKKYLIANSSTLMKVCFDRPLAIMRSEKNLAPEGKSGSAPLSIYGINEWNSPSAHRKLERARQEIEMKKKFLVVKTQEEARSQKSLQSKADESNMAEYQATVQAAREAVERAKIELDQARNAYNRGDSQATAATPEDDRKMDLSALELQHAGFKIVEILSRDFEFLESQNDTVRALRWLWRSRGRHYRLLHEEQIPPRYHYETPALGGFLVSYAEVNQSDGDTLFDLIRIYLQPLSSVDFSFITNFILHCISGDSSDERKLLIFQR